MLHFLFIEILKENVRAHKTNTQRCIWANHVMIHSQTHIAVSPQLDLAIFLALKENVRAHKTNTQRCNWATYVMIHSQTHIAVSPQLDLAIFLALKVNVRAHKTNIQRRIWATHVMIHSQTHIAVSPQLNFAIFLALEAQWPTSKFRNAISSLQKSLFLLSVSTLRILLCLFHDRKHIYCFTKLRTQLLLQQKTDGW
ncbi:hypothetical protein J6590_080013 [Homalodisca vitripennis]|nr:hypothetical protein J6590_080013 [Homalodisca vitripennis]